MKKKYLFFMSQVLPETTAFRLWSTSITRNLCYLTNFCATKSKDFVCIQKTSVNQTPHFSVNWHIVFLIILFCSFTVSASLGISPAKEEIDFTPGAVHTFNFIVSSDDPNKKIKIYFDGDLAEYAVSNVEDIVGSGEVIVTLTLPNSIDPPGDHALYFRAIESPPEGEFLGSRIDIGAFVKVFVPYPGHYALLYMDFPDGNVGEIINVGLAVYNKGTQPLNLRRSKVEIYSSQTFVKTLDLPDIDLSFAGGYNHRYSFNSSELLPGEYFSIASVETPEVWQTNGTFRIGSLFMNITYFTTNISGNSIQPFFINVQNLWNNDAKDVYANVNITNSSGQSVAYMRTPSVNFAKWEQKVIQGFIDPTGLKGNYTATVELNYLGKTTIVSGQFFVKSINYLLYSIIAFALALLLLALYYFFIKRRPRK
mgnify:CR=1 FL=1